jgi:hypothetical protein
MVATQQDSHFQFFKIKIHPPKVSMRFLIELVGSPPLIISLKEIV